MMTMDMMPIHKMPINMMTMTLMPDDLDARDAAQKIGWFAAAVYVTKNGLTAHLWLEHLLSNELSCHMSKLCSSISSALDIAYHICTI